MTSMSGEEQTPHSGGADAAVIRVVVSGALGRMGSTTCSAVDADPALTVIARVDPAFAPGEERAAVSPSEGRDSSALGPRNDYGDLSAALDAEDVDVVVDFTVPAVVRDNVLTCLERHVPVVVGTTGLSPDDLKEIENRASEAQTPVLVAPNFALGAVLMMEFARQAARHLQACEIVELHHDRKVDAPSGTSKLTRFRIEEVWRQMDFEREVPIHSVRLPGLVAHQEVIFGNLGETLTIRHDSLSRESFMPGVLTAVKRVQGLQGLVVGLENVL